MKQIATNKRAYYDYFVEDTLQVGIVLVGAEVKSCRASRASIKESYVKEKNGELFICNMHIAPYAFDTQGVDPLRTRKLLVHKKEILKLQKKQNQDGYSLIPLQLYFLDSLVKLKLGICKGKKKYDKREAESKKSDQKRIRTYKHY